MLALELGTELFVSSVLTCCRGAICLSTLMSSVTVPFTDSQGKVCTSSDECSSAGRWLLVTKKNLIVGRCSFVYTN